MKYTDFEVSALRHIDSCYHILDNLTASPVPYKKQKESRLLLNIYYLSGYAIECSLKFAFFKAIKFSKRDDIDTLDALNYSDGTNFYSFAKLKGKRSLQIHKLVVLSQYLESVDKSLPRDIPLITQVIPNLSHKILADKWDSEIRYSSDYAKTAFSIDSVLLKQYLDDVVKPIFDKLTKR
jgi:hypothetical protein